MAIFAVGFRAFLAALAIHWAVATLSENSCPEGKTCPAVRQRPTRHSENLLLQVQVNHNFKKTSEQGVKKVSSGSPPKAMTWKAMADADQAPEGSPVAKHGHLRVKGNQIVDKNDDPVRLKGMSLFWSQWIPQFWTAKTVNWLTDDWHVSFVRAPMAVDYGGYLVQPEVEKAKLEEVVQAAIENGIYVVVDWHDHAANEHSEASEDFFREMAEKYGHYPNVMFETFNEPIDQHWQNTVKPYHESVVQVIREHSDNIIILGTPTWSQDVDKAAADPVQGKNLAYTIHFYANTHRQELRDKVKDALDKGLAIFATEWGTCDSSGDGALDLKETESWLSFFKENNISDANWAIGDKEEACAALLPGASGDGGWKSCELTESGAWVRSELRGEAFQGLHEPPCPQLTTPPPGMCSSSGDDCSEKGCCNELGAKCFRKNEWYATCRTSCTPGEDPNDPPEHRTPWSCEEITRESLGISASSDANKMANASDATRIETA
eukprot:TRINITY_DN93559_c0_g1_i1.p1 TRINITY_DN93559_c0_g1~~TRINITY_DN93559_c0_g1_i1.p1  ORF type:complete len:516 (+),score=120.69 TRINITY_DN93559_c0_g1_i1:70-1548(+)